MAGVKLSADELAGATEIAPVKLSADEIAGATSLDASPAPAPEEPGFFRRGWESIKSGASDVARVAKQLPAQALDQAIHHPLDALANPLAVTPSQRREALRGLDSMVTLGYGKRAARAVEDTNFGRAMNRVMGQPTGQGASASMSPEQEASDVEAAPGFRTVGGLAGLAAPGAASLVGKGAGKLVAPVTGAVERGASALAARAATVPLVGKTLAAAAKAGGGAATGAIQYEAAAPALSAASADAEGHRLEAAEGAATDAGGLLLSGGAGAAPHVVAPLAKGAGRGAQRFVENATKAADEYIAKDIQGDAKGASTSTARKQMSRAAADFPEVIGRDPELRDAIANARHNDLAKVQHAVDTVRTRLDETTADKPQLYQEIDRALPNGGVKMKDVVKAFKDDIHEWEHGEHGGEEYAQQIAKKLKERLQTITGSEAYGAKRVADLPEQARNDVQALEQVRQNLDTRIKGGRAPEGSAADLAEIDKQIAAIKGTGTERHEFDPEAVISTRRLRRLVTDAQNTAFTGEGSINGTERYKRALDVAATPSKILEAQLERAKGSASDAVSRLETMDRDTHVLLATQAVLDQRLLSAKQNSAGAGGKAAHAAHTVAGVARHMGGLGGAALLAGTGHYVPAALMASAPVAPAAARAVSENAARFGRSPQYKATVDRLARAAKRATSLSVFTRDAAAAGFPVGDARRLYKAAHPDEDKSHVAEATP